MIAEVWYGVKVVAFGMLIMAAWELAVEGFSHLL